MAFNTRQESLQWQVTDGIHHTVINGPKETIYELGFLPFWNYALDPNVRNMKELSPLHWNKLEQGAWFIDFANTKDLGLEGRSINGELGSQSIKLFSLLGHAIVDKVREEPTIFKTLVFQSQEESRRSLNSKLASILAKELGGNIIISNYYSDSQWLFLFIK